MKIDGTHTTEHGTTKLVNAQTLLQILFEDCSRPSLRSLRTWTKNRVIPCVRCGGLVFYDLDQVKTALARRTVKEARG